MLLKLAAMGALGYLGYRYYQDNYAPAGVGRAAPQSGAAAPEVALAGGPLSSEAALVHSSDDLPAG
jgi:uncharacterized membrane protein YebE (DUF533 family)